MNSAETPSNGTKRSLQSAYKWTAKSRQKKMKPIGKKMFLAILCFGSVLAVSGNGCRSLHSRAVGINVVCCSGDEGGGLSADCHFRSLCLASNIFCSCFLTVLSDFDCSEERVEKEFEWKDHSTSPNRSLNCHRFNWPNPKAHYTLNIQKWSQKISDFLIPSLGKLNVSVLEIDLGSPLEILDLSSIGESLRNLKRLSINGNADNRPLLRRTDFLRSFSDLRFLKIQNVDFAFPNSAAKWTESLERLHIESSSLNFLPKWIENCRRLTNLLIRRTNIHSLETIGRLPSLVISHLDSNRFFGPFGFSSAILEVLDLSDNQLEEISDSAFALCRNLRFLDLSENPISVIPKRVFRSNDRLRHLHLESLRISGIGPEELSGLSSLKFLSLSNNPSLRLDAFAFLSSRAIQTLLLDNCNLTEIPLAVTQCCSLLSLSLNGNLFYDRSSMPTETLALLSHVDTLAFERNPLIELPSGLFLLDSRKVSLIGEIVDTLSQLPLWHFDRCTPFWWNIHLKESSPILKKRLSSWNVGRMRAQRLEHCQQQFETIRSSLSIYREIQKNSGCEASRKLRSARESCKSPSRRPQPPLNCSLPSKRKDEKIGIDRFTRAVTLASLALNLFFVTLTAVRILIRLVSFKSRRDERQIMRKSLRVDSKSNGSGRTEAAEEETRLALLRAFELSRN